MRETQVAAFQSILDGGLLSRMRTLVYTELHNAYLDGDTLTSGEIDRLLSAKLEIWTRAASPRAKTQGSRSVLEYLYTALLSPFGIKLECDDVGALRQKLYAERRAAQDPDLDQLSFVPSPHNPQQLWLVKRPAPEPSDA